MNIKDIALSFEAIKISLSQDKNGVILRLGIHPDDVPPDLLTAWVGSRFVVSMVQIGDDEQPVEQPATKAANKAVSIAGMICRNEKFWQWLSEDTGLIIESEAAAVEVLHDILGIDSRAELKTNKTARDDFFEIRDKFMEWLR